MTFGLGVIEGFYGAPYTPAARRELMRFLGAEDYAFYLYAPKADRALRADWREPYPDLEFLGQQISDAHAAGLRWGLGLTPLDLHRDLAGGQAALRAKLRQLGSLDLDHLAILFDDMHGDVPELARTQGDILKLVADETGIDSLLMCPSYYTDQAILDKLFGPRPEHYLRDLGRALDPQVQVFWTGPKVCSTDYPAEHLDRVNAELGRPVLLWDNYPVNDGPRMCKRLHLRAVEGRGPQVAQRVAGIAVNPMNQAWLSRLPLLSLPGALSGRWESREQATEAVARELLPPELASRLLQDLPDLQRDGALDLLIEEGRIEQLLQRYEQDHPAAAELRHWLRGESVVGPECLTDV